MPRRFLTVPEELLEHAECVADYFAQHGYTVKPEHGEIGYPYLPTLHCRNAPTTVLVEISRAVPYDRIRDWIGYARSCSKDTRIVVALPGDAPRSTDDDSKLREAGVGLLLSDGSVTIEAIVALDLALNVQLPDLATLPVRIQKLLGPIYQQFDHSHWRDGFAEACQVVADHAARYLETGLDSGRIMLVSERGRRLGRSEGRVRSMTLGQLAVAFTQINLQNLTDAKIAKILKRINPDRIVAAHKRRGAAAEARLRKNVGQHMWSVVDALKELLGIK